MHRCREIQLLFLLLLLAGSMVYAQNMSGATGIRDTSYSNARELQKLQKAYPFIRAVPDRVSSKLIATKGIVYCKTDSRNLVLDLFAPAGKKVLRPAVMIIHGGGWRTGSRDQHHAMATRLAELGYVCITPEYRLSTEALYPAAVHDLKAALRWMHANAGKFGIDTNRIAVAGFSAGGQLASLLGTTMQDPLFEGRGCHDRFTSNLQAVINMDGILAFIHPESGEGDDSKKTSAATHWFGFSKAEKPELWREASALRHVGPNTTPVLFLNSSVARMHAGREDFTAMLKQYRIPFEIRTFTGAPHSFPLFNPWFDSTIRYMDAFLKKHLVARKEVRTIIVAKDGSGDVAFVQDAFNIIPRYNKKAVEIRIRNGIYHEKLFLDSTKSNITLIGEDPLRTILSYNDHSGAVSPKGDTIHTFNSYSFFLGASKFSARNISFQNTAGYSASQAVAVHITGDKVQFDNCRFIGNQDVLFLGKAGTRQFFSNCYIEGTTDFIFGASSAWFQRCHINSKKNSHITAASTPQQQEFGFVFKDCVLTSDSLQVGKVSLGRPWRPYAAVTYLDCYMGSHIITAGWDNWRNPANEKTARYAEYNSYGPGAGKAGRASWATQLTEAAAQGITPEKVLRGWNPKKNNQ